MWSPLTGCGLCRVVVRSVGGSFEVGDALVGCGELAFEVDDADGGGQRHVLVEQAAHSGGKSEIGTAVAALAAGGAAWG
jgi:hypothetical protein